MQDTGTQISENAEFQATDKNGGTRTVDDRSTRTQQTSIAVDSSDLASSQPPLEDREGCQNVDVEQIGFSSKKKKKKKKKKKTKSADDAISVDEEVQDSTTSSVVCSGRESSLSTTTVNEAGRKSTHLSTPIGSENGNPTQCSHLPKKKKKKKKKKKTEMNDSNTRGEELNNCPFVSSDAVTAIPMDAPLLADDGNEELGDELQDDKAIITERIDNQEDPVVRKEISATFTEIPNEMGSVETNILNESLDEIQEEGKRSLAGVTVSDGINNNPLENVAAEKEERESDNDDTSSDLLDGSEG